jgi:integrase/recombinase XerD
MELHIYPISIENAERIAVVNTHFNTEFPVKMKQINGSLWTPEHKCWHIPRTKETWELFQQLFEGHTIIRDIKTAEKSVYTEGSSSVRSEYVSETFKVSKTSETSDAIETRIIAQRCAAQPDRIFFKIPTDRIDWKTYINQVENSTYHSIERVWSVPKTKALYQQFVDYFGVYLLVDKETPIILKDKNIKDALPLSPQYTRFSDKLTVFEHPTKEDYWCLNLPKPLVPTYLKTVRHIQGRQWNNAWFVWDIPKTALTEQFLDTYLPDVTHWDCVRYVRLENGQSLPNVKQGTHESVRKTPEQRVYSEIVQSFPKVTPTSSHLVKVNNASDKVIVRLSDFWRGKLSIVLPYKTQLIEKIKTMSGKQWHADRKCWTLPYSPLTITQLEQNFGDLLDMDLSEPNNTPLTMTDTTHVWDVLKVSQSLDDKRSENVKSLSAVENQPTQRQQPVPFNPTSNLTIDRSQQTPNFKPQTLNPNWTPQYKDELTRLEEKMTLKRMAIETIKLYKNCFGQFIKHYDTLHPEDITKDQIIKYMVQRIQAGNFSETQQNNFISAIKCYYELVLGRERTYYDLQRPKMPFHLPNILSESEFIRLMNAVTNIKHRCILLTIYSSGIRLSELTNLRIQDLREADNCMFIKGGKGKKDRLTLLSPTLLEQLKPYFAEYTPNYWLFEGQTGGKYSNRSVQNILRAAVEKSGVNPFATVHTLRHSFATHLVLGGENLITVQHLLGHEDLTTTEIYIHLTGEFIRNTKSPLDRLKF